MIATDKVKGILDDLQAAILWKKSAEAQIKALQQMLYNEINEAEQVVDEYGELLCTWKYTKDVSSFNTKRLQHDNPELYAAYLELKPGSRKLLFPKVKE